MIETEQDYEPIKVEAAIDDAYRIAEELDEYSVKITELIEQFEKMPYSVNRNGAYDVTEMTDSVKALNQIENYYWDSNRESEEISQIEMLLTEKSFKPARREGKMLG